MPAKKTPAKKSAAKKTAAKRSKPRLDPADAVYQLLITLRYCDPPVWRRVLVPGDCLIVDLHWIIQRVMSWDDSHMHQFVFRGSEGDIRSGGSPDGDQLGYEDEADEYEATLAEMVPGRRRFLYEYDFGDCWMHDIKVERIVPRDPAVELPACLAGERACPPDDCGGTWGYVRMLEIAKEPKHEDYEYITGWLGQGFDPAAFDVEAVNRRLRGGKE